METVLETVISGYTLGYVGVMLGVRMSEFRQGSCLKSKQFLHGSGGGLLHA